MEEGKALRIKKDIFDGFRMANIPWNGSLSVVDFLSRLYDLSALPSSDPRYRTMEADIQQHCINNDDWDEWWIVEDSRINLHNFEKLQQFLIETVHPVVRPDAEDAKRIAQHINGVLEAEGVDYILEPVRYIFEKPVFDFRPISRASSVEMERGSDISGTFAGEQMNKCREKLKKGDYDGAVTNSRSFLEGVFDDIHKKVTGENIPQTGELVSDFKKIQKLLFFSPEQHSNNAAKAVLSSLSALINNIDTMGNKMGDRHRPNMKAEAHHASLCVNVATIVSDFLYTSLSFQFRGAPNLYKYLIDLLDSDMRLKSRNELVEHKKIRLFIERLDVYSARILINRLIDEYEIVSYKSSDILFSATNVLWNWLVVHDVNRIYDKHNRNNQAVGLVFFLKTINTDKKDIVLSDEMIKYVQKNESI